MMHLAKCQLQSLAPYCQGRNHDTPKIEKELDNAYEERTWRERCHTDENGFLYIPALAFRVCIAEVAKFLSMKIPGKGNQLYTKNFEAGILVPEGLALPIKKDEVPKYPMFVPSNGQRGGGRRVWRFFPVIEAWAGEVNYYILDDTITEDVFSYHLGQAGNFIGLGSFRVRNRGMWGRFKVENLQWSEM